MVPIPIPIPINITLRFHGGAEISSQDTLDVMSSHGAGQVVEAVRVDSIPLPNLSITYTAHVADTGDVPTVQQGEWIGITGKEIRAFSAVLEGEDAHKYLLRYKAKLKDATSPDLFGGDICGSIEPTSHVLALVMWLEEVPPVDQARESFVANLDHFIQLYDLLDTQLAQVESSSKSADESITTVSQKLESQLTAAKIASTTSSVVSIVGVVLLFTPLAPVGGALTVAGAVGSVGTSLTQSYIFEGGASQAFQQVMEKYGTSSKTLQNTLQAIENDKDKLIDLLTIFLAALGKKPGPPIIPKPNFHYKPNEFSKLAFEKSGLSVTASSKPFLNQGMKMVDKAGTLFDKATGKFAGSTGRLLGKTGSGVVAKGLPLLGKALPIASIVIDVVSIVNTWTSDNETLKQAENLQQKMKDSVKAFQDLVKEFNKILEDLLGDTTLRKSIQKLLRLAKKPPGPPDGPGGACAMLAFMQEMVNVPLLIFANLLNDQHQEAIDNEYVSEILPETHITQLSGMTITAPLVDLVFDQYQDVSDINLTRRSHKDTKPEDDPNESVFGIELFRSRCWWVAFGDQRVFNVDGSSWDNRVPSWIKYWEYDHTFLGGCLMRKCYVKSEGTGYSRNTPIVGGHMELENPRYRSWYILPICQNHNAPWGEFDRFGPRGPLHTHDNAYAVKIPRAW
ncbi:uncharacterized protein IL334_004043 [Kwoniella shivajii]|uniref:Uncharacterized protein n=1 Tax=Kwoniella shivajii TaxID=564305 RepID=A0ABZ1D3B3_9TREE|nr:hypothetical protein IL334_004043 [Kwoniella shivajii]